MPGSINQFKSSFKTDVARNSRFDVMIPVPLTLIQYRNMSEKLSFRCEIAGLPSRTLSTLNQQIYGPSEKFPYQSSYGDLTLSFIVSDDMSEKLFFDAWLELINPSTNYNFKYKNDYTTQIAINQYDLEGKKSYSVDLVDAFPIDVSQMDLDWSSEGFHKLNVVMSYSYWRNNSVESLISGAVGSVISSGLKSDAIQGIPIIGGLNNLGGNILK